MPKGVEILKSQVKVFVLETSNQKEGENTKNLALLLKMSVPAGAHAQLSKSAPCQDTRRYHIEEITVTLLHIYRTC